MATSCSRSRSLSSAVRYFLFLLLDDVILFLFDLGAFFAFLSPSNTALRNLSHRDEKALPPARKSFSSFVRMNFFSQLCDCLDAVLHLLFCEFQLEMYASWVLLLAKFLKVAYQFPIINRIFVNRHNPKARLMDCGLQSQQFCWPRYCWLPGWPFIVLLRRFSFFTFNWFALSIGLVRRPLAKRSNIATLHSLSSLRSAAGASRLCCGSAPRKWHAA